MSLSEELKNVLRQCNSIIDDDEADKELPTKRKLFYFIPLLKDALEHIDKIDDLNTCTLCKAGSHTHQHKLELITIACNCGTCFDEQDRDGIKVISIE